MAIFCLLFFVATDFVINFLNDHKQKYQEIKQTYAESVNSTKHRLISHLSEITASAQILNHLRLNSYHSLNRALLSQLSLGEIDNIHVFDKNCTLITAVNIISKYPFQCSQIKKDGLVENIPQETSSMSFVKTVATKKEEYYFVAHVHFTQSWLKLYPILFKLFQENNLKVSSVVPASKYDLLYENSGAEKQNKVQRSLWIQDSFYSLLYPFVSNADPIKNVFFYPLLTFLLFLLLLSVFWAEKEHKKQKDFIRGMIDWTDKLEQGSHLDLYKERNQSHMLSTKNDSDQVKSHVLKVLVKYSSVINDLTKDLEKLRRQYVEAVKNMKNTKEYHQLKSLTMHVNNSGKRMLEILGSIESQTQDISDIITHATYKDGKNLLHQVREWQQGVAEQGARKFIRSLSERAGRSTKTSMLEEQINFFIFTVEQMTEQVSSCVLKSSTLSRDSASCLAPLKHWHQLSSTYEEQTPVELATCLEEVRQLVEFESPNTKVDLQFDQIDGNYMPTFVPSNIWYSGLYNLIRSTNISNSKHSKNTIVIRWDSNSNNNVFSLSIRDDGKKAKGNQEQLDLACSLFADYNIDCDSILSAEQIRLLTLKWEHSNAEKKIEGEYSV